MKLIDYVILLLCIALLGGCSSSDELVGESGGVTETIGFVVSGEGAPASDVSIQFVPVAYVPGDNSTEFETRTSNSEGAYSCVGITNGTYNLMYKKGGEVAFRESLTVVDGSIETKIVDTLSPIGSLSGVVRLHEKHNSENIFILIRGTNRYLKPLDSTGRFLIDSLAEGEYTVTFLADYENYAKVDTTVLITSGFADTLDDTIKLDYLGIETPSIETPEYDSALLHATIKWKRVLSEDLAGYQLFRKVDHPDSLPRSIAYMLQDTFYIDSCENSSVQAGERYLYQVSCINNHHMSGKLSPAAKVHFQSLFSQDDSVVLEKTKESEYASMVCRESGMLYLVRSCESKLHVINSNTMEYVTSYPLPDSGLPTDISLVDDTTLLVATNKGVYEIDTTANRRWRYSAFGWKNEKGTSGRYTLQVSSLNLKYFYFTASSGSFDTPDAIMRFNCFGGKSEEIFDVERASIEAFYVDSLSETLFLVSKKSNRLVLEQSPLHYKQLEELYSCAYSSGAKLCPSGDNVLSLLTQERLICVDIKKKKVVNQTFVKRDLLAVTALPTGERVLYSSSGKVIKVKTSK